MPDTPVPGGMLWLTLTGSRFPAIKAGLLVSSGITAKLVPGAQARTMEAGQLITGGLLDLITVTVNVCENLLPHWSDTVATTEVVPNGNTVPDGGEKNTVELLQQRSVYCAGKVTGALLLHV
jgi:hypothetical protein